MDPNASFSNANWRTCRFVEVTIVLHPFLIARVFPRRPAFRNAQLLFIMIAVMMLY
jgi:hypothetical protein